MNTRLLGCNAPILSSHLDHLNSLLKSMFSKFATVRLTKDQLATTIGDDVVLLGMKTGTYYGLEGVGAHIWNYLQKERTVGQIVDEVLSVFDAEREEVEQDVTGFVKTLEMEGLVTVSEEKVVDSP